MSDSDIVQEFLVESYENLDRLDRDLVGLEKNPQDQDALAGVFRTIHTIKGTCGFLGFGKLEKVAHVGENLLTRLRDGHLTLNAEITTALLSMVDAVRQMLKEIGSTGQDGDLDYPELRETLTRLQSSGVKSVGPTPESAATTTEPEPLPALEAASSSFAPERAPETKPKQETLTTEAEAAPPPAPRRKSDDAPRKATRGKIGGVMVERGMVQASDIARALEVQERGDRRRLGEILVDLGLAKPEDVLAAQQILEAKARDTAPETIRVGVHLLDKLMTLVGELVLARNQLVQLTSGLEDTPLVGVSERLNLIATELQGEVMKTRMQPIGNIWAQFPRTVRDVALGCGKQVNIEMEGKETELDKTIIEAIKDPLTHLVRNAVDHGIELPAERATAGKDNSGRLTLRAFHEGGQVNIEISDDGAGLNASRIRKKAVERGIVNAEQSARMNDREIFNLIFLPGFSTAEKVTNVSGRGVGMDVVKTNVERIGGTVDVQSIMGQGTTVRVKIPLTLAIVPALVVTCGGERYAIPQVSLLELLQIERDEAGKGVEMVHGAPVCRLRERLLPLVYLDRELQLADAGAGRAAGQSDAVNVVVLQADERRFELVVDEIIDTEEIVVKPLGKHLKTAKIFAGASIMGDGKVALILDVLGPAQRAHVVAEATRQAQTEKAAEAAGMAEEKQTFLLFTGPGDARMAIPLSTLARLEEFPVAQVEMSGGQWATQYRGQILPLIRLNVVLEERRNRKRVLESAPELESGPIRVLVLSRGERSYGLVVERILDIVEDLANVRSPATRAAVLYSAVIGERITELLDIPAILQSVDEIVVQPDGTMKSAAT